MPRVITTGLVFLALTIGPLLFGSVEPWARAILAASCYAALSAAICLEPRTRDWRGISGLEFTCFAIIALGCAQLANAVSPVAPLPNAPFSTAPHLTSLELRSWGAYLAIAISSRAVFGRSLNSLSVLAFAIVIIGSLIAVIGIAQQGQGNQYIYGLRMIENRDPFGPFYNRNHAAALMTFSFWMALGLFTQQLGVLRRLNSVGERGDAVAKMAVLLLFLFTLGWGLFVTESRGAVLSIFGGFALATVIASSFHPSPYLRISLITTFAVTLCWLIGHPIAVGLYEGRLDLSSSYRIAMLKGAYELLKESPWFGVGLGCLSANFEPYRIDIIRGFVRHLHSDWGTFIVELGLLGCILPLAGIVMAVHTSRRNFFSMPRHERAIPIFYMLALFSFVIHATMEFAFQTPGVAVIIVAALAAVSSRTFSQGRSTDSKPEGILAKQKSFFAPGIAALFLAVADVRPGLSSLFALQASKAIPEEQLSLYSKALRLSPQNPEYAFQLSRAYFRAAVTSPTQSPTYYNQGLITALTAYNAEPLNPRYRTVLNHYVRRLGRAGDSILTDPMRANGQ